MVYDQKDPPVFKIEDYRGTSLDKAVGDGITRTGPPLKLHDSASARLDELKALEQRISEPIPPIRPDRSRPIRNVVAAGCFSIYAGTIIPGPAHFAVYTGLGVGSLIGAIELAKYAVQRYRG